MDQRLHGTYPEAPGGHQDRGPIRREVVIGAYSALVLRDREYGVDRDPRDGDRDRRDAEPLQVGARLVEGHEVALDVAGEPHSLDVEVGDHDRLPGVKTSLRPELSVSAGLRVVARAGLGARAATYR